MNIIFNNPNYKNFGNLDIGEMFECDGGVYLKVISASMAGNSQYKWNAVNLQTSDICSFLDDDKVFPVKGTLHIE